MNQVKKKQACLEDVIGVMYRYSINYPEEHEIRRLTRLLAEIYQSFKEVLEEYLHQKSPQSQESISTTGLPCNSSSLPL